METEQKDKKSSASNDIKNHKLNLIIEKIFPAIVGISAIIVALTTIYIFYIERYNPAPIYLFVGILFWFLFSNYCILMILYSYIQKIEKADSLTPILLSLNTIYVGSLLGYAILYLLMGIIPHGFELLLTK